MINKDPTIDIIPKWFCLEESMEHGFTQVFQWIWLKFPEDIPPMFQVVALSRHPTQWWPGWHYRLNPKNQLSYLDLHIWKTNISRLEYKWNLNISIPIVLAIYASSLFSMNNIVTQLPIFQLFKLKLQTAHDTTKIINLNNRAVD